MHRFALKPHTVLHLSNATGEAMQFLIESELGRGGSCIVYQASRTVETGDKTLYRIKEFYPYALKLSRNTENCLIPAPADQEAFCQGLAQFRSTFSTTNKLFYSGDNYACLTNQIDIFRQNNTCYIVSTYSSSKTLATYQPCSLKECISLVKQVAHVLGQLHQLGYLYLDTKPDNVLVVDGDCKFIQLFDFDSLVSMQELKHHVQTRVCTHDKKLSYTKGFAPIEVQTQKLKRIGTHSDVYGVGALLFYLLFGRTPNALDCEADTEYPWSQLRYDDKKCDDRLFGRLTNFFHTALAVASADRYQTMQSVKESLQELERFADVTIPRLFSTKILKPKYCFGREEQFERLDSLLAQPDCPCVWLTGMGGIGKSTFIREYLLRRRNQYDTVLYVPYQGSMEETISDDRYIEINTLHHQEQSKGATRYFDKKLAKLRELVRETACILVIDNFTGGVDADLKALLQTECKVVLVTRQAPLIPSVQQLHLSAVTGNHAIRALFQANLGRSVTPEEQTSLDQITHAVEGHTLVLELIAKQIATSHITLASAATLTKKHGFSAIAVEKVDYEKDSLSSSDTIGAIIDALFSANGLSDAQKTLMKVVSLIGTDGMDIRQLHSILTLPSLDDANELIKGGWLMLNGDSISMHHVLQEVVHRWTWTEQAKQAAEQLLLHFYIEIRLESTKNNLPKQLHDVIYRGVAVAPRVKNHPWYPKLLAWRERYFQKTGLIGAVTRQRYARILDDSPANMEKLLLHLSQSQGILMQCRREPVLQALEIYNNLLYVTVLHTPQHKEEFILSQTKDVFSEDEITFVIKGAKELLQDGRNAVTLMKLYARVILLHVERNQMDEAKPLFDQAERLAKRARNNRVYALYYNLLSNYCDILLNGAYDAETPEQEQLLQQMLLCIDKTLHYAKRSIKYDDSHLYAVNLLAKATILVRSGYGTDKEIFSLLNKAKNVIEKHTLPYAEVRLQYYLVWGWYHAFVDESLALTTECIDKARALSDVIISSDLQRIEDVIIPSANLFFELKAYVDAIHLLYEGIRLCASHANTDAYDRIKQELCDHLWEVGLEGEEFELCHLLGLSPQTPPSFP